ncbi:sialin-like [Trichogramma pretiosum]|uniref:sialin-like n=1 Tax=Trichogramma pretiosum TaxID=7493 RepID=UPI0006C9492B|nr:sialin-like [Trichogramma pretiosum]
MTSEPLLYKDKGPKYYVNLQIAGIFFAIIIFQTFDKDLALSVDWKYYVKKLVYISLLIPAGGLATNWSAKKLLCLSIAGIGIVHLLTAIQIGTIHHINDYKLQVISDLLLNILIGAIQAPVLPCVYALLARLRLPERRATDYSIVFSAKSFILALYLILSRWSSYDHNSVYARVILGLMAVFWSIVFHYLGSNCDLEFVDQAPSFKPQIPWRSILSSLPVWTLILSHAASYAAELITYRYMIEFRTLNAGIMLTVLLIWVLAGIGSGWLSDSFVARHRLTRLKARKIFNSLSTFVPGAAFVFVYAIECIARGGDFFNSFIWVLMKFIIILLINFRGSGFMINHMDLSPYYVGILIAITQMANQIAQAVMTLFAILIPIEGIKTSIQDKWSPVPASYQEEHKLDKVRDLL